MEQSTERVRDHSAMCKSVPCRVILQNSIPLAQLYNYSPPVSFCPAVCCSKLTVSLTQLLLTWFGVTQSFISTSFDPRQGFPRADSVEEVQTYLPPQHCQSVSHHCHITVILPFHPSECFTSCCWPVLPWVLHKRRSISTREAINPAQQCSGHGTAPAPAPRSPQGRTSHLWHSKQALTHAATLTRIQLAEAAVPGNTQTALPAPLDMGTGSAPGPTLP